VNICCLFAGISVISVLEINTLLILAAQHHLFFKDQFSVLSRIENISAFTSLSRWLQSELNYRVSAILR
jgi:hypothetical protein